MSFFQTHVRQVLEATPSFRPASGRGWKQMLLPGSHQTGTGSNSFFQTRVRQVLKVTASSRVASGRCWKQELPVPAVGRPSSLMTFCIKRLRCVYAVHNLPKFVFFEDRYLSTSVYLPPIPRRLMSKLVFLSLTPCRLVSILLPP